MLTTEQKFHTVRQLLDRYIALPRRHRTDLADPLQRIKLAQHAALRLTHEADSRTPTYATYFAFYLDELHSGLNLERLASEGDRTLKLLTQLNSSFELMRTTFEFSLRAQELDDALAQQLLAHPQAETPAGASFQQCGQLEARLQQARLLAPLGPGLAPYAHSRLAYGAFKLGVAPLKLTGLAPVVTALEKGFVALRALPEVEPAFTRLIQNNLRACELLYRPQRS